MKTCKIFSILLALILITSMCPISAFASSSEHVIVPNGAKILVHENYTRHSLEHSNAKYEAWKAGNLESLGEYVLPHPTTIVSVTIPSSVKVIDHMAFGVDDDSERGPSKLETVAIAYGLQEIRADAFRNTEKLKNIVIPGSVKKIDGLAFYKSGLKGITLSNGLKEIGSSAFSKTPLKRVVIPNGVTHIGNAAFSGCDKLTDIYIPSSVTDLYDMFGWIYAYGDATNENNRIMHPNLTVHGVPGSAAEKYANATKGVNFKPVTDTSIFDIIDPTLQKIATPKQLKTNLLTLNAFNQ